MTGPIGCTNGLVMNIINSKIMFKRLNSTIQLIIQEYFLKLDMLTFLTVPLVARF